jgi:hypothetical protein
MRSCSDENLLSTRRTVFGEIPWVFANGEAVRLVIERSATLGHSPPVEPFAQRCAQIWQELLHDRRSALGFALTVEFKEKIVGGLRRLVDNRESLIDRPDFEHALSDLDVYCCFSRAANRTFPEQGIPEVLSPHLTELRNFVTERVIQVIMSRPLGAVPWPREILEEMEIPWLPGDFWWRHLTVTEANRNTAPS